MPSRTKKLKEKKTMCQYNQKEASHTNNPPIGLVTPETGRVTDIARLIIADALLLEMVSKIAKHFHPEKIIHFSSRTWGALTRASDDDILVLMHIEGSSIRKASEISRIARPGFLPMDVIVRTSDEIKQSIRIGDPFIKRIMKRGQVLYG